jgi:hypothetical protein
VEGHDVVVNCAAWTAVDDAEDRAAHHEADDAQHRYESARRVTIVVLISGLLAGVAFGLLIARGIVRRVRAVSVVIDGLAADAGTADVLVDWAGGSIEGASVEPVRALDPTRRMFRVSAPPAARSPLGADVERGRLQATVMSAAESVGVAERAMGMAVEYAKERKQFGRAIGTYQAVSHACAQMLLEVRGARSAVYWAAWALDHEPETAPLAAACAKAYAGDAGRRVPRSALQVHGGIGFTWEHDLHFFLKRGEANAHAYGSGAAHREQVAGLAGL